MEDKKELKELVKELDHWEDWQNNYNKFVPLFIEEASKGNNWDMWNQEIFREFFEQARDQCVSSLQQGYFTNVEKEKIKNNWNSIAPLLKELSENQDVPNFELYQRVQEEIRKYTDVNRRAGTYRLIASLQPHLLCTIVNEGKLRSFVRSLNSKVFNSDLSLQGNWFNVSNTVIQFFKDQLSESNTYNIMTLPWELYEYFNTNGNPIKNNEMSESEVSEYIELLEYKKQIILQGPPGTGKTKLAKEMANELLISNDIDYESNQNYEENLVLNEKYVKNCLQVGLVIKGRNSEYTVVSVDDTGVNLKTQKTKPEGWKASFKKIIESFNQELFEKESRTGRGAYEDAVALFLNEDIKKSGKIIKKTNLDYLSLIQFHSSYMYEDFVRGIVTVPSEDGQGILYEVENKVLADFAQRAFNDPNNNYVLIIDEINRANLSSVLGELIYALEYRDEEVECMYGVNGDNKLVLPSNLYIIGTMNTADRSVGHIDYAIRRRFAFVDVLPKDLSGDNSVTFDSELFNAVKALFTTDEYVTRSPFLSSGFDPKDVALGHSYFIDKSVDGGSMTLRLEYEIKPILREYIKDGILIGKDIEQKVEELETKWQS